MFLYIFARDHNRNHSCEKAIRKYKQAPKASTSAEDVCGIDCNNADCLAPKRRSKRTRIVAAPTDCQPNSAEVEEGMDTAIVAQPQQPLVLYAVANERSKTMHSVVLQGNVYTECSWSFQGQAIVKKKEDFRGKGYFTCGTCYGSREPFT